MPMVTSETVVLLSGPDDAAARRNLEDFAVLLCDQAKKRGSRACAGWQDGQLRVRLQNGHPEAHREVLDSLANSAAEQGATVTIGEDLPAGPPICAFEDAPISWGMVVHARLTRELLSALPEGAFVAPASIDDPGATVGRLGPSHVRAQQWQKAQRAGLAGCVCRVFWSESDYNAFVRPDEAGFEA